MSARKRFGYDFTRISDCEEDAPLQRAFAEELRRYPDFELALTGKDADLALEVCFHEARDANRMEGALMLSFLSAGLLPAWYSEKSCSL